MSTPSCATTAIGSLPVTEVEAALAAAFSVDVPFLPELADEPMISHALAGLPGARGVELDRAEWEAGRGELEQRLDAAFSSSDFRSFEPALAAWRPFLERVRGVAKVQLAGPATVRRAARVGDHVALDQQIFRLLLAKYLAMVKALRSREVEPMVFVDEPGLRGLRSEDPRHRLLVEELKLLAARLRKEGAMVGLHCCANTEWAALLNAGFDVLSFDARLSLDALFEPRRPLAHFVEGGGRLALGLVPTEHGASYRLGELVDAVDATVRATLPGRLHARLFSQLLLTPACGLAMHTPERAEAIFSELREAQTLLRQLSAAPEVRC